MSSSIAWGVSRAWSRGVVLFLKVDPGLAKCDRISKAISLWQEWMLCQKQQESPFSVNNTAWPRASPCGVRMTHCPRRWWGFGVGSSTEALTITWNQSLIYDGLGADAYMSLPSGVVVHWLLWAGVFPSDGNRNLHIIKDCLANRVPVGYRWLLWAYTTLPSLESLQELTH